MHGGPHAGGAVRRGRAERAGDALPPGLAAITLTVVVPCGETSRHGAAPTKHGGGDRADRRDPTQLARRWICAAVRRSCGQPTAAARSLRHAHRRATAASLLGRRPYSAVARARHIVAAPPVHAFACVVTVHGPLVRP